MTVSEGEMNSRLIAFTSGLGEEFWQGDYRALNHPQQVVRAVWQLEQYVNSGGFDSYFLYAGEMVPVVVQALREFGAENAAGIVESAIKGAVWDGPWEDRAAREGHFLDDFDLDAGPWDALDQEFCTYPDNLTALLYRYASAHRKELGFPY